MNCILAKKQAIEYQRSLIKRVDDITTPLKEVLGIPNFGYFRIYKDGRFNHICTSHSWSEYYIKNIKESNDLFANQIRRAPINDYIISLSPEAPEKGDAILEPLIDKMGFWNWVTFHRKGEGYVESFIYIADKNDSKKKDLYINSLDLLKKYNAYFTQEFQDIITTTDIHALGQYENYQNIKEALETPPPLSPEQTFMNKIPDNKLFVKGQAHTFSRRQMQCLRELAKAKTLKEIGRDLNISPRTVESYLEAIKTKTGARYKSDLIKIYQDSIF